MTIRIGETPAHELEPWTTIASAKDWLDERLDDGVTCPTCTQHAQRYRRGLNSRMAVGLIKVYRHAHRDWAHLASVAGDGCEVGKLRYWGLVEEDATRAGWWRITDLGEGFVRGGWRVQKYAYIYNGDCFGLDGPEIDIREALANKFDLRKLLAGE